MSLNDKREADLGNHVQQVLRLEKDLFKEKEGRCIGNHCKAGKQRNKDKAMKYTQVSPGPCSASETGNQVPYKTSNPL